MNIRFAKSVQNYIFLRTQPNKMHKITPGVHILNVLCSLLKKNLEAWRKNSIFATAFNIY